MKKIISTLLATTLAATAAFAADIVAQKVDADLTKVSYTSPFWKNAKFSEVTMYPQTAIKMNDKTANKLNSDNGAKIANVAAVYNGKEVAFLVVWDDATMNIQTGYKTDSYADGFALQFPSEVKDVNKLPYIGMGSDNRPVAVYLQKAVRGFYEPNGDGNVYYQLNRNQTEFFGPELKKFDKKVKGIGSNDYEKSFVSEGFRSMTEIKDASKYNSYSRLSYKDKKWMGTLARPITDSYATLNKSAFPVAIATWDGAKLGRDGIKYLTPWLSVELEGGQDASALVAATSEVVKGDIAKGKEAVSTNGCAGCHQIELSDPANLMGPSLANVGGYATAGYLRESLLNPSAVIVPGYNRNAHSNYMWYTLDNGKRVSSMTDYTWLDAESLNNIIAYLQTLKAEVK